MKHEYYADEKDAAKWTVVVGAAGPNLSMIQLAMMGRGDPLEAPQYFQPFPAGTDPAVEAFFAAEQQAILGGAARDSQRIEGLGRVLDPPRTVTFCNPAPYTWPTRNHYFDAVIAHLNARPEEQRDAVLLDACTGLHIFNQNPRDDHLHTDDLRRVWGALRDGDRVVVFQYQLRGMRAELWVPASRGAVAAALGIAYALVQDAGLNLAVRFFVATK